MSATGMARLAGRTALLMLALLLFSPALHAQGCAMCKDTTAGSAPQVRRGLRRAIPVMAVPALALFAGMLVVAARARPGRG